MVSAQLLKALAVTAELTGTQLSEPAARVLAGDLERYPETQVFGALTRCRKELRSRLTVADIISRLDDGRPGAEEAWSMIPRDEAGTVVWTDEMRVAYGVAVPLIEEGENVQARMAFLEQYRDQVQKARDEGIPVKWSPSLGYDVRGRERVLLEAVEKGRLPASTVDKLLPNRDAGASDRLKSLIGGATKMLA